MTRPIMPPIMLAERLRREIEEHGAISLATYMQRALADPQQGYYMRQHIFGTKGDFTTAPEISQMFGEMIAAWLMDLWQRLGAPAPFCLLELGPGRGTLMADIVRAARIMPPFAAALVVHFVEISPPLRALQKQHVPNAHWHDDLSTLPAMPTLCIANEFFDALPIRQFRYTGQDWREVMVDVADGAFVFSMGEGESDVALPSNLPRTPSQDALWEVCPQAQDYMHTLATHLLAHGGAGLVIDYGYTTPQSGDSLQALQRHKPLSPLAAPGESDLTAHVNFHALAAAAQDAGAHTQITTQGAFLQTLGLAARADNLKTSCADSADAAQNINSEYNRLTDAAQMGQLFKVLGIAAHDAPPLAGFGT